MGHRRERKLGDGLGEILDGDVLRVALGDGKTSQQPVRITDGSFSDLALCKPGFRREVGGNIGDVLVRDGARRDREEQYALRDAEQAAAYKNTSEVWWNNPPTGQGTHDLPPEPQEGGVCTINGYPGRWERVNQPATFRAGY